MSSEWQSVQLNQLITIKHGFAFKGEYFCDELTQYQLTTPGNFAIDGGFQLGKGKYYNGPIVEDYILKKGDLIVTMTDLSKATDTLGYSAVVPETKGTTWLHNQRVGLVQIKTGVVVDTKFLHYLMRSDTYRQWVVSSASGSTVKHTSPSRICDYRFDVPPYGVQVSIGEALTTLDDRISLLRETNATLEAIAQALFKSWFVDFDPVRDRMEGREPEGVAQGGANVASAGCAGTTISAETAALFPDAFEESELGLIPRGWKVVPLSSISTVTMGLSPKGDSYNSEGHGVPLINGPVEFGEYFPVRTKWTSASDRVAHTGDLIFCVRGSTTGRRVVADGDYCIGRGVCSIRAHNGTNGFLFQTINFGLDRLLSKTTGSVFPSLSAPDIKGFNILAPEANLIDTYEDTTRPLLHRIQSNQRKIETLTQLRDTLLPRLISGHLRLPEADAAVVEGPRAAIGAV
ncbi:MAG: restriction endonuclease subunit S [bacterium]|nr:restriction endonuclease subunit S [bacterium]